MEAMASGLPVIASRIRGNTDLVHAAHPLLCDPHSVSAFRESIRLLAESPAICVKTGSNNAINALQFSTETINSLLTDIYLH